MNCNFPAIDCCGIVECGCEVDGQCFEIITLKGLAHSSGRPPRRSPHEFEPVVDVSLKVALQARTFQVDYWPGYRVFEVIEVICLVAAAAVVNG